MQLIHLIADLSPGKGEFFVQIIEGDACLGTAGYMRPAKAAGCLQNVRIK